MAALRPGARVAQGLRFGAAQRNRTDKGSHTSGELFADSYDVWSGLYLAARLQKAPPNTYFANPTNLVDQFFFLVHALSFVPDDTLLRFPMHIKSSGKREQIGRFSTCGCTHDDKPL